MGRRGGGGGGEGGGGEGGVRKSKGRIKSGRQLGLKRLCNCEAVKQ